MPLTNSWSASTCADSDDENLRPSPAIPVIFVTGGNRDQKPIRCPQPQNRSIHLPTVLETIVEKASSYTLRRGATTPGPTTEPGRGSRPAPRTSPASVPKTASARPRRRALSLEDIPQRFRALALRTRNGRESEAPATLPRVDRTHPRVPLYRVPARGHSLRHELPKPTPPPTPPPGPPIAPPPPSPPSPPPTPPPQPHRDPLSSEVTLRLCMDTPPPLRTLSAGRSPAPLGRPYRHMPRTASRLRPLPAAGPTKATGPLRDVLLCLRHHPTLRAARRQRRDGWVWDAEDGEMRAGYAAALQPEVRPESVIEMQARPMFSVDGAADLDVDVVAVEHEPIDGHPRRGWKRVESWFCGLTGAGSLRERREMGRVYTVHF